MYSQFTPHTVQRIHVIWLRITHWTRLKILGHCECVCVHEYVRVCMCVCVRIVRFSDIPSSGSHQR
jgi:hypothetical protein